MHPGHESADANWKVTMLATEIGSTEEVYVYGDRVWPHTLAEYRYENGNINISA